MNRYLVELEAEEREALEAITRKGSQRSQQVVNALVLLNCDQGEFNERRTTGRETAGVLRISMRRVDRVKKRFVEDGLEAALGNRQGRRAKYLRKADGEQVALDGAYASKANLAEARAMGVREAVFHKGKGLGVADTAS